MSVTHRDAIKRRNRRRLLFSLLILIPYALFGAQYLPLADFMAAPLGAGTLITRALVWFVVILFIFLGVEYLYIRAREAEDKHHEQ